jgi:carboxypeptidase family protein
MKRFSTSGRVWIVAAMTTFGCASVPRPQVLDLSEPTNRTELWQKVGCPSHILPDWRAIELTELSGQAVDRAGPLAGVFVYARPWPDGKVIRTTTDDLGRFRLKVPIGVYEVAICASGWNPWRGAVRVSPQGFRNFTFELELGV